MPQGLTDPVRHGRVEAFETAWNCLQGFVDQNTGEVELYFDAEFNFNAGQIYKVVRLAPTLHLIRIKQSSKGERNEQDCSDTGILSEFDPTSAIFSSSD